MPIVTFWLNAFIPKTVTGYTKVLTVGPHLSKTAIPLPGVARTWPGNWNKDWDAGYLTDQRSWDPLPTASRRMQSLAEVELSGPTLVRQSHTSSGTTEVNLVSGKQTGYAVADMSRCKFTAPSSRPGGVLGAHGAATQGGVAFPVAPSSGVPGHFSFTMTLKGAAGDPLVGMAADIDYTGTITIANGTGPGSIVVSFDGMIDAFPAYDCYASYNGTTKEVFKSPPPAGNTVANLLGGASRAVTGTARFP